MPRISIDFSHRIGKVRRLHGVNNGPVAYGGTVNVTRSYREMGIPLVRLHDPNWPHPREVDIYAVFPDFSRDSQDPSSYDFDLTDEYIRTVVATGARIVYRLGVSIEHALKKRYTHPPADFAKWAEICIQVIRHYTQGWADGFVYPIDYWEIWNEPDTGDQMWTGTREEYFELYRVASLAIRSACPHVKIGGPALGSVGTDFMRSFLGFAREHSLPLDFQGWHVYADKPATILADMDRARALLDEYGFGATESHMNEWNYVRCPEGWGALWAEDGAQVRQRTHMAQKGMEGASFAATVLLEAQDHPLDAANYYDGQPVASFCGLFDQYGVEQKTCLAFKAMNRLAGLGDRVEVLGQPPLSCVAATCEDGTDAAVMVANFEEGHQVCSLDVAGVPPGTLWELALLDHAHSLESVPFGGSGSRIEFAMPPHTVALLSGTCV